MTLFRIAWRASCLLALLTATAALAQPAAENLVTNSDYAADLDGWRLTGELQAELVDSGRADLGRAVRLRTRTTDVPWNLQLSQALNAAVAQRDALYVRVWLRSPESVRVTFVVEQASEPYTKSLNREARTTPEWQEYRFVGRSVAAYEAGAAAVRLMLGHDPGTLEVAGLRVENHGAAEGVQFDQTIDYWGGRPHDDAWRAAAEQRIAELRTAPLTIRVNGALGAPVPGATVRVEQVRHHFRFGTAAPAGRFVGTDADSERFRAEVARLYNTVTFENDLKWHDVNPAEQQRIDAAIDWLDEHEITLRGHVLVWNFEVMPPRVRDLDAEAMRAAVHQRVTDQVGLYRDRLYLWDVVNEAVTNTEIWDRIGWDQFPEVFRLARAAGPNIGLAYNEYNMLNDREGHWRRSLENARRLIDAGAPITTFGEQAHQGVPLVPLPRVLELLDEAAKLGLRIEITEFDLGGVDDEEVHAKYVADFMTACFSHPSVDAFILWGFWEGSHWRAGENAAMFRRDWSKKPAQDAWEDLVLNQWWTRAAGETDGAGEFTQPVFYGRHRVTVEHDGQTVQAIVERTPDSPDWVMVSLP